jgi:hypothetical protein
MNRISTVLFSLFVALALVSCADAQEIKFETADGKFKITGTVGYYVANEKPVESPTGEEKGLAVVIIRPDGKPTNPVPVKMLSKKTKQILFDKSKLNAQLKEGLVLYFPFEDDCKDYSGKNNHGRATGKIGYKQGVSGNALTCKDVGFSSSVNSCFNGVPEWSFTCWLKLDQPIERYIRIIEEGTANGPLAAVALMHDNKIRLNSWNGAYHNRSTPPLNIELHKWNFLAVVARTNGKEGSAVVYFNKDKFSLSHWTTSHDLQTRIGMVSSLLNKAGAEPDLFNGQIDEVRFYQRALAQGEIQVLRKQAKPD